MSTMSTDEAATTGRRPRRQFSDEFKAQTVPLVLDEGKSIGRVARDLDLTASALRLWVEQTRADQTQGRTGLTTRSGIPYILNRRSSGTRGSPRPRGETRRDV